MEARDVKLGRVVSVSGSQAVMLVETEPGATPHDRPASLQMGKLVKMQLPGHTIFGLVWGSAFPCPDPTTSARR